MPPRVTLAMTARRDSPTLARCLASCADLMDEIVIVTDPNAAPAWQADIERFDARLVEKRWSDSFSAVRDEALRQASGEWVFYLDADEWLDASQREALRHRLADLPEDAAGFTLSQLSPTPSGRTEAIRQVRLFRNLPGVSWRYRLHEQVGPSLHGLGGQLRETDLGFRHDGYADRAVLRRKQERNLRLLRLDAAERPADPFVLFNAGNAALDLKRPAEAAAFFQRSAKLGATGPLRAPTQELYSGLTRAYALAGDRDRAFAACRNGLARLPDNPELLFVEGTLLMQAGNAAGAEERLRRCLALRPAHGRAWQGLGDLLLTAGRHDEAEESAARLAALPGLEVDAAVLLARALMARRESAQAAARAGGGHRPATAGSAAAGTAGADPPLPAGQPGCRSRTTAAAGA